VNDNGLLAVANEGFTGSTQRVVLASRVSETVGNGALIGVLRATSKKAPRGKGSPTRGKARFCVAVGKRANDAPLNCCNYNNNST
jgi:hypothetical protein